MTGSSVLLKSLLASTGVSLALAPPPPPAAGAAAPPPQAASRLLPAAAAAARLTPFKNVRRSNDLPVRSWLRASSIADPLLHGALSSDCAVHSTPDQHLGPHSSPGTPRLLGLTWPV